MPSTRRTLLRSGLLGVLSCLAGCSGDRNSPETDNTTSSQFASRTTDAQSTTERTPDGTTSERPTTVRPREQSMEFVHRSPVLDSGIGETNSDFFAQRIGIRQELDALDPSAARGDVPGQNLAAVERFIEATNLRETTLFVVQTRLPSPTYGLDFSFLDPWSPPQVVVQTRRFADRGSNDAEPVTSTLLIRIPARTSSPSVTVADVASARWDARTLTTFGLPNDRLSKSVNADPLDGFSTPSGAIATSREDARRLLPETNPYAEFVRETDFGDSYLLGVQTRIRSGGVYAWPAVVARNGDHVAVDVWQFPFAGGPSAEFEKFVLARLPGEAPARGSATVREPSGVRDDIVDFSSDPAEWPTATGDKSK